MLQSMRDNLKGVVAYCIVGLIILVFVLSYVDAFVQGRLQQGAVASVNGVDITERDLKVGMEARRQQLMNMLGDRLDPRFVSEESLRGPVLQELIQRRLMEDAAKDGSLAVATQVIDKQIVETTFFQKEGKFDPKHYSELLARYGYTPASYRQELVNNYLMVQYQNTFMHSGFVTDREVSDMAGLMFQTRSFDVITLPLPKALAATTVTEEEITAYYKQHPEEFMTEALVAAEYIEIRKADLLRSVAVTDEDIRAQYDAEVKAASEQVERHAAHILVEEKADGSHQATLATIQQRLAKGEDFGALAKLYSADPGSASNGGDVGVTTGSSFVPEFEDALKELSIGQVSEPVKTDFGYHVIKLLGLKTNKPESLEASRSRIEREIRNQQADELYVEQVELLRDARQSATSIESVANTVSSTEPPAINRVDLSSRQALMMKFRNSEIVDALFADGLAAGDMTDVIELDGGDRAIVLRVSDLKSPSVKPIDQVHETVAGNARRHKAMESLKAQAAAIEARARSGEALDAIARSDKLALQQLNNQKRVEAGVEAEVLKKVFGMPAPADVSKPQLSSGQLENGDHIVVALRAVTIPSSQDMTPEQRTTLSQRVSSSVTNREQLAMQELLESRGKIVRRQAAVE